MPHALDVVRATRSRSPGVDAVTIATPPHTHAALVLEARSRRASTCCARSRSPATPTKARALLAAAERAGVVHLLGTEFRFDTGQALLARVVHDGAIGEPRLALFVLHVPVLADATPSSPSGGPTPRRAAAGSARTARR